MSLQQGRLVLVVEDFNCDYETVREAARLLPYAVRLERVTMAEQCLPRLRACREADPGCPALVLLDLSTPGIGGLAALRKLREDEAFRLVPVVVLTATSNPCELEACLAAGANACHSKPIAYLQHRDLVASILDYWLRQSWPGPRQEIET